MKNLFAQKKIGHAGLSVRFVLALAVNDAGHLFAGVLGSNTGGVFRSLNNGDIWEAVNAGLTRLRVQALGFDRQCRILAGTAGDGVFRSIDRTISVDEDAGDRPLSFALTKSYPNTFNPSTTNAFDLKSNHPHNVRDDGLEKYSL